MRPKDYMRIVRSPENPADVSKEPTDAQRPGDRLSELYARHVPSAIGFAYLLTGVRADAEDVVHEAFIRVAGRLRHLRAPEAFDSYLMRTVVNLHTSRLRRLRTERAYLRRNEVGEASVSEPDVAERDRVWRALRALPPRQRTVLVLRYFEDLSERATAEVMRCSVAAVKSLTTRALHALRNELGGDE